MKKQTSQIDNLTGFAYAPGQLVAVLKLAFLETILKFRNQLIGKNWDSKVWKTIGIAGKVLPKFSSLADMILDLMNISKISSPTKLPVNKKSKLNKIPA